MRVLFIKDYTDGVQLFKRGSNATLWDAEYAISKGYAIPYSERYELPAKEKTTPKGNNKTKKNK
jgi:hypothetical protein